MRPILLTLIGLLCIIPTIAAQDTLRIMQYNLLYYGVNSSFCSSLNNAISEKNLAMTKIVRHISPDIIAVNEIGPQDFHHDLLLSSALNLAWPERYARAGFSNINASSLVNDLYYDKNKIGVKGRFGIYSAVRDADAYLLYLKPSGPTDDTAFFLHIVTHLKAGSASSDQQSRATQTADIMSWLSTHTYKGNIILSGDFNMKGSDEQAWYNLTQYPDQDVKLLDPVNAPGQWFDNYNFRFLHTQSSRTSTSGCGSGGGLDDRFDVILLNRSLLNGENGLVFLPGSYTTVGQDGLRFNESVRIPPNTLVPDSISQALEIMSDHLPVMLSITTTDPAGVSTSEKVIPWISVISGGNGNIGIISPSGSIDLDLSLFSIDGRLQWMDAFPIQANETRWLPLSLKSGIYILSNRGDKPMNIKIIVQ